MTSEPELLLDERGALGRITLNRPKALNSLTLGMVRGMTEALVRWRDTDSVRVVLVEGAGDRGLCAGGDIRALYDAAKAGDEDGPATFWAEEYRLNVLLARYPKPVVSLMDGICMGGGVGVSAHGSHRVVTERSKIGMPEVGIGFAPDVGGTYLLSRAPGELGTYLGLTGLPIGAADAIRCGMADTFVPSEKWGELGELLVSGGADEALAKLAETAPEGALEQERDWIDTCFATDDVAEILRRLDDRSEPGAAKAAETMRAKSPTSLKVTLRALRSARALETLEEVIDQEFRVSMGCVRGADFVEGVRATLVDKDRDPHWRPATLDEVDGAFVDTFFVSLGEKELGLSSSE